MIIDQKYNGTVNKLFNNVVVTDVCVRHKEKKSKFYLVEDEKFKKQHKSYGFLRGLCSKCAVRLANSGYLCEEILDSEGSFRKQRIEWFGDQIISLKNNYDQIN